MSRIWILFPIAFAADFDCVNLSPNVTDEECGKLDITVQYFDANENCSQALFKEKFESLDLSYAVLFEESFTAIREKLKATVWMTTRREVEKKYQDIHDVALRIGKTTQDTSSILNSKEIELEKQTKGNQDDIAKQLQQQKVILDNAVRKLSQAQDALRNLDDTIGRFAGLHNMYITIRAQSNRVHLCNAELRRVNAKLMLRGAGKDAEEVLEDCRDLLSEDLAQKCLKTSATYCSSSEATRPRRFLSTKDVQKIGFAVNLTMAECLEEANYPDFRSGRTYENEDSQRLQDQNFAFLDVMINTECTEFSDYTRAYLIWKGMELLESDVVRVTESLENINRQWSYIAEATETCSAQARTMYQKFKANAELLAKGQACGKKMTELWAKDVEKCLEANKWKSVWIPWYNLSNLLGENSNCVQTQNIIVGCMVTAFATVVTVLCMISCIWSARNCSCCCFGRAKSHRSRRRKYVSDSDDTDDSSDEEHYRRKHSLKSRKKKGKKSDRDDKKAKKQKGGKKDEKGEKKAKKGKKNKKDCEDHKKAKSEKKNNAESVRDDSRKGRRENDRSPEDEMQVQWWLSGEHARSMSPADCERGLRLPRDVQIVLQPRKDPQVVHEPPTNAQVRYEPRKNAQVLYEPPTNAQVLREPRQNAQVLREPRKDTQIRYEPRQNAQRLPEPVQKTEALPESLKEVDVLRKP